MQSCLIYIYIKCADRIGVPHRTENMSKDQRELINTRKMSHVNKNKAHMPGESYRRRFWSFLLC